MAQSLYAIKIAWVIFPPRSLCDEATKFTKFSGVSRANTLEIFSRIPSTRISSSAADFAQRILEFNQRRLLTLREDKK